MGHDPCLSIHVFGSVYKIYASGSAARSMSPDPCLRIYVSASISVDPISKIHVSGVHICDPARRSMSPGTCLSVHSGGVATRWTKIDTALQRERFGTQETRRGLDLQTWNRHRATTRYQKSEFQPHLDVSLPIRNRKKTDFQPHLDASQCEMWNGISQRNANFDLLRRVFCGPAQGKHSAQIPPTAANLKRNSCLLWPEETLSVATLFGE